ncbi:2-hydroxyacid dehydrogenase [Neomicrococcus lactis]|uniref:2-hydroxyacid dehydrogenase n=1 Tax=Neomicrococcus lactis TaxID=732241 RepID=A0A7W8YBM1_9MICC|nr:2-hydroxyacid dehydrogenase [Neomicrococcus lactis]MBB5598560.1 hypothetical protein [Neomicrococcus lactis]
MTASTDAASTNPITGTNILQVVNAHPNVSAALRDEFGAQVLPPAGDERVAFLAAHGGDIRVAVCSGRGGVDTELMSALPNLEAVINFGAGYDATDVAQAAERGIVVSNTPDVLNDCVADTTLALYLDMLRRISSSERYVRAGKWESQGNYPLTARATGRTVGNVGLGRIGRAIAERLEGFKCTIEYHNRRQLTDVDYTYRASLKELAESVEVLIVAATGGPETNGLVSAEILDALGESGYLINISRGTVVDEQALVAALRDGTIAGAGLDVFEDEPHVPEELLALDNVVLLPHVGSATVETRADMASLVLENLRSYLTTGTLVTPIS